MTSADLLAALGGTPGAYVATDPGNFNAGTYVYLVPDYTRAPGDSRPMGPRGYKVIDQEIYLIETGPDAGKPMDKAGNPADGDDVGTDPTRSMWFYTIQDRFTFEILKRIHQSDLRDATDAEALQTAETPDQWSGQP